MTHAHAVVEKNIRSAVALEFTAPALRCAPVGQFAECSGLWLKVPERRSLFAECIGWEIRALRGDGAAIPRVACSSPGTPPLRSKPSISDRR